MEVEELVSGTTFAGEASFLPGPPISSASATDLVSFENYADPNKYIAPQRGGSSQGRLRLLRRSGSNDHTVFDWSVEMPAVVRVQMRNESLA